MKPFDVLVLGQGLAGSAVAWRMTELGQRCVVVDRGGADAMGRPSASRVAAGLMTPVTGRRLTVDPQWEALRSAAATFYRQVEANTGAALFEERASLRVLKSAEELGVLERRLEEDGFARHARLAGPAEIPEAVRAPFGAFWMPAAARLNTVAYLDATRRWLLDRGEFVEAEVDPQADFDLSNGGVTLPRLGLRAQQLVLCQGFAPAGLVELPLKPAKGEVLQVECLDLEVEQVLHHGVWLAPEMNGPPGSYHLGATFDWDANDSVPTAAAKEELLDDFSQLAPVTLRVANHHAAVRPTTADRQPLVGVSRQDARIAWLNGLGSKGALLAPSCAERLAKRLKALT